MATRMQQRRGTASQWTSANPVLNAGEIGWESDTNKFKIGDGTNHWASLDYFADIDSTVNPAFGTSITFEGATADSYETTLAVTDPTADRTITLPNATGTVVLADGSGNVTVAGNLTVQGSTTTVDSTNVNVVGSFTFEGVTANDFETRLEVTDPTGDRVVTIPDVTGTIITTGNLSAITSLNSPSIGTPTISNPIFIEGGLTFEGATANDFETVLAITDPTADRTITLPDVDGTVITTGNLSSINSLGTISSIVFEGSTADDFELTLAGGDPTADRTVSFPDAGGTVVIDSAAQTLTSKTLTSPVVSGLTITDGSIVVEGSTPNDFETTVTFTDPTADRTITIPDASGTIALTDSPTFTGTVTLPANTISQSMMADDSVGTNEIGGLAVTEGKLADGAVTNAKVSASAAIAQSKIDGLTTSLSEKLALAGGTMTGAIAMGTSKITGLGTPTDAADAATKAYVDALGEGLHIHASVVAATTANITLATAVENGDVLDGVTLATGNRILVKNQSTASENGIYVVAASGAPSRATDFDSPAEIDGGDFVFVTGGTANDNKGFVQINTVGTIGTDPIEFSQFSGAGTFVAGNGLTLTDNSFSINTSITADLSTAQTLTNKTLTSPKINLGINGQTGTTYTFVLDDAGKFITASNASAITVTIPPSGDVAYPVGTQLNIIQKGAGQVTFAQGSGVTINSTGATATAPKLRVRYSSATAVYEGSNVWYVVGDIS
jgi:hypothetical protein